LATIPQIPESYSPFDEGIIISFESPNLFAQQYTISTIEDGGATGDGDTQ
jgi:hypothetical protein